MLDGIFKATQRNQAGVLQRTMASAVRRSSHHRYAQCRIKSVHDVYKTPKTVTCKPLKQKHTEKSTRASSSFKSYLRNTIVKTWGMYYTKGATAQSSECCRRASADSERSVSGWCSRAAFSCWVECRWGIPFLERNQPARPEARIEIAYTGDTAERSNANSSMRKLVFFIEY